MLALVAKQKKMPYFWLKKKRFILVEQKIRIKCQEPNSYQTPKGCVFMSIIQSFYLGYKCNLKTIIPS